MEDFYRLLDIEERWDSAEISGHLTRLNREYRQRVRHQDATIREEANQKLQQINRAMSRLGPDGDRAAYDRELAGYRAVQELQQPLADVNLYQLLQLPQSATAEQIEAALAVIEAQQGTDTDQDETVARRAKLVALARHVLLDPARRQDYDTQLAAKLDFEAQRAAAKPVPLLVNGTEVQAWLELEGALDAHPGRGLFLLQDGEIEAWLRWSLGQRLRADWVRGIAARSRQSETPFMELEEVQRLVNGNRPLAVYRQGEGPTEGPVVRTRHPREIPAQADQHWGVFLDQLDHVVNWLAAYGDEDPAVRFNRYPPKADPNIRLERLLAAIDPGMAQPQAVVEGVRGETIDFEAISTWEAPARSFTVKQQGRGYLYGRIEVSEPWIAVDTDYFGGGRRNLGFWPYFWLATIGSSYFWADSKRCAMDLY